MGDNMSEVNHFNPYFEMFKDDSYFHLWAVRDIRDRSFNSPRLFHFAKKEDAEKFKELLERSY